MKWEYCEAVVYFDKLNEPNLVRVFKYNADGKHDEYKELKAGKILALLGLEGWELVAAYPLIHGSATVTYVFKRPLNQKEAA